MVGAGAPPRERPSGRQVGDPRPHRLGRGTLFSSDALRAGTSNSPSSRSLVRRARRHLDEWLYAARSEAFEELFVGGDPRLTERELALLDRIDSVLSRRGGDGLWGTDQYGILATGAPGGESGPRVVCVYHPEIPEEFVDDDLDDATEERLNEALWDYAERVARGAQRDLGEFLRRERALRSE